MSHMGHGARSIGHACWSIGFCSSNTIAHELLSLEGRRFNRRRARAVPKIGIRVVSISSDIAVLRQRHQTVASTPTARSTRSGEHTLRSARRGVAFGLWGWLLAKGKTLARTVSVGVGLVAAEFRFAELVQFFATGVCVDGVVHGHISWWFAAAGGCLKILTISTLEDIDLGVVYLGINMVIHCAILGAKVLRT
jgi:hypothetical protein